MEQNAAARVLSASARSPFPFKSATIFAPTGYPEMTLVKKAYPVRPPVLNSRLVNGDATFEILLVKLSADNIAVMKKYGKSAGKTVVAHRFIPHNTADEYRLSAQRIIAKPSSPQKMTGSDIFLKVLENLYTLNSIMT